MGPPSNNGYGTTDHHPPPPHHIRIISIVQVPPIIYFLFPSCLFPPLGRLPAASAFGFPLHAGISSRLFIPTCIHAPSGPCIFISRLHRSFRSALPRVPARRPASSSLALSSLGSWDFSFLGSAVSDFQARYAIKTFPAMTILNLRDLATPITKYSHTHP